MKAVATKLVLDPGPKRAELPLPAGGSALLTLAVVVVALAGLYFARDILVPLALATLLSFALAPRSAGYAIRGSRACPP